MLQKPTRSLIALLLIGAACLLISCAEKFPSYGIVIWSADEKIVPTASLVGISARSQLHKTLQIRTLDEKGDAIGDPISIPVWRVKEFDNQGAAQKWLIDYKATIRQFAKSNKQALPIRRTPAVEGDNIVYRLRDQEVVKVLDKQAKEIEQGNLKGNWIHVLTDTGTDGWVFSVQLDVYEPGVSKPAAEQDLDTQIKSLAEGNWRPEEFVGMLEHRQLDLDVFKPDQGFFLDLEKKSIHIGLVKDSFDIGFKALEKIQRNTFQAVGSNVQIAFKDEKSIIVQFQKGNTVYTKVFVNLDLKIEDVYQAELNRRAGLLAKIGGKTGTINSSNYGSISLNSDGSFNWANLQGLQGRIIPASAGTSGTISFNIYPDSSLLDAYQGVITFNFNGSNGSQPVDFLYQTRADGIQLEYLPRSLIKGNIAKKSDSSPTVLFFAF